MSIYANSTYPVRSDLEAIHASQIAALGKPGTWGDGSQRLAIVQEARAARVAAGVQEASEEPQIINADLPDAARRVARELALEPRIFEQTHYEQALADGLIDASYVEIVGLVSRIVNFDVMARGLGIDMVNLPEAQSGKATGRRPAEAVEEGAWAPTIPNGSAGGATGKAIYGNIMQPFIIRALSLVPEEALAHIEIGEMQYLPIARFMDFGYAHHEGFSRSQVETVAARVSAINECFY